MKAFVALAAVGVSTAVAVSVVGLPISAIPKAAAGESAPPPPTESTTTTVTAPAPVLPVLTTPPVQLTRGAEGADVLRLQERLVQLHYDPGTVDGRYGEGTALAVMAFQKVVGLGRTGAADTATLAALASAADPAPLVPAGAPTRANTAARSASSTTRCSSTGGSPSTALRRSRRIPPPMAASACRSTPPAGSTTTSPTARRST